MKEIFFFFSNSECLIDEEGGSQEGLEHYTSGFSEGHSGTKLITSDSLHYVTILIWRNCSVCEHLPHGEQTYHRMRSGFCVFQFLLDLIQTLSLDFTV